MVGRLAATRVLVQFVCSFLFIACVLSACASDSVPPVSPSTEIVYADDGSSKGQEVAQAAPQPDRTIGPFRRWRAMAHVRKLAGDIGVRVRATEGERKGAAFIAGQFRSLGYEVFVQKFSVDGGTSRNVVATWPGAQRYPIILGGHMDSVPTSPGANDNASGVSVLLEIARLVRGTVQGQLLKFIAFGSEEFGSDGTHHVGL
jgi:hypothetical protein